MRAFVVDAFTYFDAVKRANALLGKVACDVSVVLMNNGRWLVTCGV